MAEGTAICPSCDHILDSSFLTADPPDPGTDPAAPRVVSRKVGVVRPASGARPAVRRTGTSRAVAAVQAPVEDQSTRIKSVEDIEREAAALAEPPADQATRIKSLEDIAPELAADVERERAAKPAMAASPSPRASGPRRAVAREPQPRAAVALADAPVESTGEGAMVAPEQVLSDAKNFVGSLGTADKLAFIGAAVTVLVSFFPWKETAEEGEILGLMSLGFPVFLLSVFVMVAIGVRVRQAMPNLNPVVPWLAQLGAICLALLWSLVFIKLSWDATMVPALIGNEEVATSKPVFGVYLAILMQITALGGTLLGLKEKPA